MHSRTSSLDRQRGQRRGAPHPARTRERFSSVHSSAADRATARVRFPPVASPSRRSALAARSASPFESISGASSLRHQIASSLSTCASAYVLGQPIPRSDRLARRLKHELRIAERSEGNPEDAARVTVGHVSDCLQGEPRLAATSGAGQREQADVCTRNQLVHLVELPLPAQEGRRGDWQVRPVQALERGEVAAADVKSAVSSTCPVRRR
jgi:hypothetical protein